MSDDARIKEARNELFVAYLQSAPSDDRLIMARVLNALNQLDSVLGGTNSSSTARMLCDKAEVSP